jgi:CHRD domain
MIKKTLLAVSLLAGSTLALANPPISPNLTASLDGPSVPVGGDPDGVATFAGSLDPDTGNLCYELDTSNVAFATIAHIHEGTAGAPGRPLVSLALNSSGCTAIDPVLAQEMLANPSAYYVDVVNQAYTQGAVRGQLGMGG